MSLPSLLTPPRPPPHPRLTMDPPRLPWEVIERVIYHSQCRPNALRNFALTCRQLRPRSHLLMFAQVRFKNRDHVLAFVDFLHDNPHLKPAVRSIAVGPNDLAPFPLLYILPSLSELHFVSRVGQSEPRDTFPDLHLSTFTCCERFGTNITTLRLSRLCFATYLSFSRVLLAFANVRDLICEDVKIEAEGAGGPVEVTRRRLAKRMQLKSLTVGSVL